MKEHPQTGFYTSENINFFDIIKNQKGGSKNVSKE